MSIISLLLFLVIIGVGLYLVGLIPMDATILTIIRVVVILVVILYILEALGFVPGTHFRLH